MNEVEIATITVKGQKFAVYVDSKGRFYCNVGIPYDRSGRKERPNLEDGDPNVVEAKSLAALEKQALKVMGGKKVAIDCWQWSDQWESGRKDGHLKHGVIVAMHSNGNAMIRWDGAKGTEQVRGYYHDLLKLDTKEKRDKYMELRRAKEKAAKEFSQYLDKSKMHPAQEVAEVLGLAGKDNTL